MLLTPEQQRVETIRAMCRTFSQADTTLMGRKVEVHTANRDELDAPAWSDGRNIYLNSPKMGSVDDNDALVKITGLNFHEFAHLLYTPRQDTWLVRQVIAEKLYTFFNMLEDQRIETMLLARYPSLRPYFVMTVLRYITDGTSEQLASAHSLTHGRRYLPPEVWTKVRAAFAAKDVQDEMEAVIDSYRRCSFPADQIEGLRCVRRFAALLQQAYGSQHSFGDPNGHGDRAIETMAGEEADETEQDLAQKWVEYRDENEDDADDGEESEDADSDADDEGGNKGKSKSGKNGKGKGAGSGGDHVDPAKTLQDAVKKVQQQIMASADMQQDIKSRRSAIERNKGQVPNLRQNGYEEIDPDATYFSARAGMKRHLEELWIDADPGWHTQQSSGRINMQRVMRGDDPDTVFDRWDEGVHDANSLEVVILIDYSISMSAQMRDASLAMWTIKSGVEAVKGEVTVIGFSSGATTFYDKKTKATNKARLFGAGGGTSAKQALDQARLLLHYSEKSHKVVFFVTDGDWYDAAQSNATIQELHAHGVHTALAYIGYTVDGAITESDRHGCQYAVAVDHPSKLVLLAKSIVAGMMKGSR